MATNDEFNLGNLDDQLNDADFNAGNVEGPSDGRSPSRTSKTVKANIYSSLKGFSSSAANEITEAMPNAGKLFDISKGLSSQASEAIDDISKSVAPAATSVKRALRKSLPMVKRFIPDAIYKNLEKRLTTYSDEISREKSAREKQQDTIVTAINDVFVKQETLRAGERQETRVNKLVDTLTNKEAQKQNIGLLSKINDSIAFGNAFRTSTQSAWMKKMLELKYIHVFTAKQTLSVLKTHAAVSESAFGKVIHNTSLPDINKAQLKDGFGGALRVRALNKFTDKAEDYVTKVGTNVIGRVKDKFKGGLGGIITAAGLAADGIDMKEQTKEFGDGNEAPSGAVGGIIGKLMGTKAGRDIADSLLPFLNRVNDSAGRYLGGAALYGRDAKERMAGSGNFALELVSELLPSIDKDTTVINSFLDEGAKQTPWDNIARTSLVEIIPGWLSKISKTLVDINTGGDSQLEIFNPITRQIETQSKVRSDAITYAFGDESARSANILQAVGDIKGSIISKYGESSVDGFENIQDGMKQFFNNVSTEKLTLTNKEINSIKEFAEQDITPTTFLQKAFKNITNPKDVAIALSAALFEPDGSLSSFAVNRMTANTRAMMAAEGFKDVLPTLLEDFGLRNIFRKDMDENAFTDEFIESQLTSGTTKEQENERVDRAAGLFKGETDLRSEADVRFGKSVDRLKNKFGDLGDPEFYKSKFGNLFGKATKVSAEARKMAAEILPTIVEEIISESADNKSLKNAFKFKDTGSTSTETKLGESSGSKSLAARSNTIEFNDSNIVSRLDKILDKMDSLKNINYSDTLKSQMKEGEESKSSSFHEDFNKYFEYKQEYDVLLLQAIMGIDGGSKTVSGRLGSLFRGLGKGGSKILSAYTDIYKAGFGAAGKVGSGLLGLGGKALPMIGSGLSKGADLAGGALKGYFNLLGTGIKAGADVSGSLIRGVTGQNAKLRFVDVYRKDDMSDLGNPLVGVKIQKKFAVKESGAVLEGSADIKEPIFHKKTGEVLVTQDDIDAGLVDKYGKALGKVKKGAIGGGLIGGLGKILGGGKDLLMKGIGAYGDIYSKALSLLGGGIKGVFNFATDKIGGRGNKAVVEKLDQILTLLKERMPLNKKILGDADGDGDRDGSYRDQIQKTKERKRKGELRRGPDGRLLGGRYGDGNPKFKDEEGSDSSSFGYGIAGDLLGYEAGKKGLQKTYELGKRFLTKDGRAAAAALKKEKELAKIAAKNANKIPRGGSIKTKVLVGAITAALGYIGYKKATDSGEDEVDENGDPVDDSNFLLDNSGKLIGGSLGAAGLYKGKKAYDASKALKAANALKPSLGLLAPRAANATAKTGGLFATLKGSSGLAAGRAGAGAMAGGGVLAPLLALAQLGYSSGEGLLNADQYVKTRGGDSRLSALDKFTATTAGHMSGLTKVATLGFGGVETSKVADYFARLDKHSGASFFGSFLAYPKAALDTLYNTDFANKFSKERMKAIGLSKISTDLYEDFEDWLYEVVVNKANINGGWTNKGKFEWMAILGLTRSDPKQRGFFNKWLNKSAIPMMQVYGAMLKGADIEYDNTDDIDPGTEVAAKYAEWHTYMTERIFPSKVDSSIIMSIVGFNTYIVKKTADDRTKKLRGEEVEPEDKESIKDSDNSFTGTIKKAFNFVTHEHPKWAFGKIIGGMEFVGLIDGATDAKVLSNAMWKIRADHYKVPFSWKDKIIRIEEELLDHDFVRNLGRLTTDQPMHNARGILDIDPSGRNLFERWYQKRFLPIATVYLTILDNFDIYTDDRISNRFKTMKEFLAFRNSVAKKLFTETSKIKFNLGPMLEYSFKEQGTSTYKNPTKYKPKEGALGGDNEETKAKTILPAKIVSPEGIKGNKPTLNEKAKAVAKRIDNTVAEAPTYIHKEHIDLLKLQVEYLNANNRSMETLISHTEGMPMIGKEVGDAVSKIKPPTVLVDSGDKTKPEIYNPAISILKR